MKKIFVCIFVVLLTFSACKQSVAFDADSTRVATQIAVTTTIRVTAESTTENSNTLKYSPGSIVLSPREEGGATGELPRDREFRQIYYAIPSEYINLVSEKTFSDWVDLMESRPQQEMALKHFAQKCNITKEDFSKATELYKENLLREGCSLVLEENEIPNVEAIYTFNNDLIDSYYRYE